MHTMLEPYPIMEVSFEWALDDEDMGTKRKFWYEWRSPDEKWLFKYPRPDTGEHWAEKIAAEIARLLDIPHARVELATCDGQRGSATKSFRREKQKLIHGNQLLRIFVAGYDPGKTFHRSSHTIENIWSVMDDIFADTRSAQRSRVRVAEYLVLDALIGNTDRHHENWGVLAEILDNQLRCTVAPSFDHASSLGRELQDTHRDRLLAEHRVDNYVEKGQGAIFRSAEEHHGPSPLQLVRYGFKSYRESFLPALRKIENLDRNAVRETVHRVPGEWMSCSERRFSIEMMTYGHAQLQELYR